MSEEAYTKLLISPDDTELAQEAAALARSLAQTQYGNKAEANKVIEDALYFYAAHRHLPPGSANLLEDIEEIVRSGLDISLRNMYNALTQKNDAIYNRLISMALTASYEATLGTRMIKDIYCITQTEENRYDQLRDNVSSRMTALIEDPAVSQVFELNEKLQKSEGNLTALSRQLETAKAEYSALQEEHETLRRAAAEAKNMYIQAVGALKAYYQLVQWQDKRIADTPGIRKKNSGLLKEQTWEAAMYEFEQANPKPKVPNVNFK